MRRPVFPALAGLALALALGSLASAADVTPEDETREGPFVKTEKTLGALLEDGFEVKGLLGSEIILVKETTLYSCTRVADQAALTYKPYFACWRLDEIAPDAS